MRAVHEALLLRYRVVPGHVYTHVRIAAHPTPWGAWMVWGCRPGFILYGCSLGHAWVQGRASTHGCRRGCTPLAKRLETRRREGSDGLREVTVGGGVGEVERGGGIISHHPGEDGVPAGAPGGRVEGVGSAPPRRRTAAASLRHPRGEGRASQGPEGSPRAKRCGPPERWAAAWDAPSQGRGVAARGGAAPLAGVCGAVSQGVWLHVGCRAVSRGVWPHGRPPSTHQAPAKHPPSSRQAPTKLPPSTHQAPAQLPPSSRQAPAKLMSRLPCCARSRKDRSAASLR